MKVPSKVIEELQSEHKCLRELNEKEVRQVCSGILLKLSSQPSFIETSAFLGAINTDKDRTSSSLKNQMSNSVETVKSIYSYISCLSALEKKVIKYYLHVKYIDLTKTKEELWKVAVFNISNNTLTRARVLKMKEIQLKFYELFKMNFLGYIVSLKQLEMKKEFFKIFKNP